MSPGSRPSTVPGFTQRQLVTVLGSLIMAVFLASLDTTVVATALPTIAGEFNAFDSLAWVLTAYIATSTIATPLLGKLSDLYGRRLIFLITMSVFLVGSLMCGLAQSMGQLIAFRAFQGLGGGGIQALAFAILGDILPPRERGRYIGYFTVSFALAAVAGPLVGGLAVDHLTWPWIFYINVPLIGIATALCWRSLRLPFKKRRVKLDYVGAALLSGGLATLIVGLEEGPKGWTKGLPLTLFALSAMFIAAFVLCEQRAPEPMIPLRLFRNPVVVCCALMGFMAGGVVYGGNPFLPLYFQDALFVPATQSGLRVVPTMVGVVIASFGCGRLIARGGGYRRYPIFGTAIVVLGVSQIARIDGHTSYAVLILPMLAMGIGMGSVFTTTSIATQNAVEFHDLGVATATVMFFRSLGGSIAAAAFGTTLNSAVRSEIPKHVDVSADEATKLIRVPAEVQSLPGATRQAVIDAIALGVGRIYWIATGAMVVAFVFALVLPERELRSKAGLTDVLEAATPVEL